jgi:glycosyltransferase involved in cell wall biosynthesis
MNPIPTPQPPEISPAEPPLVAVLLCTYQGEGFLPAQLNSIAKQTHRRWTVWASDDGSHDKTMAVLERFRMEWGNTALHIVAGPCKGYVANFLSLLCNPAITANYYAFADQDDIWEDDKTARALGWLATIPPGKPALYMTRTRLIDEEDKELGLAPLFTAKPPSFLNAMVQNIAGGNTMVMNQAARDLLAANSKTFDVVSHDWWTYLLITGAGGQAFYDVYPSVRYRQHRANVLGSNTGLPARLWRAFMVFAGRYKTWGDLNMSALAQVRDVLTPENQRILDSYAAARSGSLLSRLLALQRSGVHRQGFIDNIGLYVATIFNRL